MSTQIKEITPQQAWDILRTDPQAVLLDVRSRFEYEYVGHPTGSVNVPWQEVPDWKVDPEFVSKVKERLAALTENGNTPDTLTILALCRSGKRSMDAGLKLASSGFINVINIAEGFEGPLDGNGHRSKRGGWRYHGLPWKQG